MTYRTLEVRGQLSGGNSLSPVHSPAVILSTYEAIALRHLVGGLLVVSRGAFR